MGVGSWPRRTVDALVDSGAWVALTAVALTAAAARALGQRPAGELLLMVGLGAFAVYSLDRLADRILDRGGKPRRNRFIGRHAGLMLAGAVAAAGFAGVLALRAGVEVTLLMAAVAGLAALHLPLKHLPGVKPTYIAVAWLAVVVGLPVVIGRVPPVRALGELGPLGLALVANVLACDAADREAEARRLGTAAVWHLARVVAAAGVLLGVLDRGALRPLSLIPAATLLALLPRRADPEYTALWVDGALLVGGVGAWLWLSWPA